LLSLEERAVPATFWVSNTANSGVDSLRQAIINANTNPGADTIQFDAFVFAVPQTINLSSGEISLTSSVTINGPGSNLLTVKNVGGSGVNNRIFNISAGQSTISGLTITGGNTTKFGGGMKISF
jgi:hypothetical protein